MIMKIKKFLCGIISITVIGVILYRIKEYLFPVEKDEFGIPVEEDEESIEEYFDSWLNDDVDEW